MPKDKTYILDDEFTRMLTGDPLDKYISGLRSGSGEDLTIADLKRMHTGPPMAPSIGTTGGGIPKIPTPWGLVPYPFLTKQGPITVAPYDAAISGLDETGTFRDFPVFEDNFLDQVAQELPGPAEPTIESVAAAAQATAPPPSSDPFSTLGEQATRAWKRAYGPLSPAGLRPPPADFDRETNMQSMFDIQRRAFARPRASATQGPPSGVAEGWSAVDRNSREYQRAYQTFISRNLSPDQADVEAQAQVLNAAHRGAPENPYSAGIVMQLKMRKDDKKLSLQAVAMAELRDQDAMALKRTEKSQALAVTRLSERMHRKAMDLTEDRTGSASGPEFNQTYGGVLQELGEQAVERGYQRWLTNGRPPTVTGLPQIVLRYFQERFAVEQNPRAAAQLLPLTFSE